jgi:hypothetical protein
MAPEQTMREIAAADQPLPTGTAAVSLVMRAGLATRWDVTAAADGLDKHHPALGAWARLRGLRTLWHLPIDDPDAGRWIRRDLIREWDDHARAWSDHQHRQTILRAALHAGSQTDGTRKRLQSVDTSQMIASSGQ